jgi:hypothetical protein
VVPESAELTSINGMQVMTGRSGRRATAGFAPGLPAYTVPVLSEEGATVGKPQQPELGRSGHTPVTEGQHAREVIQGQEGSGEEGSAGPVPEANRPGHHPEAEQDQPDLEAFRSRLTGDRDDG